MNNSELIAIALDYFADAVDRNEPLTKYIAEANRDELNCADIQEIAKQFYSVESERRYRIVDEQGNDGFNDAVLERSLTESEAEHRLCRHINLGAEDSYVVEEPMPGNSFPTQIKTALDCLFTDLLMLDEGSWVPDSDSVQASLDMLDTIAQNLKQLGVLTPSQELSDNR